MKKLILIIIILNLSFASKVIYKQREKTSNSIYETVILIKKNLISQINYFIPDYLRIDTEKSFFNLSLSYDTLTKKEDVSFDVHLKFPEFKIINVKRNKQKNSFRKSYEFYFKIRPYLRIKKGDLKAFLSSTLGYMKQHKAVTERMDYYTDGYWENNLKFSYFSHAFTSSVLIYTDKTMSPNLTYTFGCYKPYEYSKKIFVLGYEAKGEKNEKPFFYSHTLFISYRQILLKSKRFYMEIKPYLLYSEEYDFHIKNGINFSIHYKF